MRPAHRIAIKRRRDCAYSRGYRAALASKCPGSPYVNGSRLDLAYMRGYIAGRVRGAR